MPAYHSTLESSINMTVGRAGSRRRAMEKVNIAEKLSLFDEHWSPRIVGELNDTYVKLVKLQGEFVWHHHEHEDEMFLVVKGRLLLRLRDRDITLEPGEFAIIPRGVEHLPIADEEVAVLLIEPKSTLNTGNVKNDRTVAVLQRV
jgi:mannose-6-phosphate isomerase-like protein (cupin superfamily)